MSRIAKNPIPIPTGVTVSLIDQALTIKVKEASLLYLVHQLVSIEIDDEFIKVFPSNEEKASDALAGTTRANINNMVHGLTKGFEYKLELVGVGYRAQVQGKKLNLTLGFSHPVVYDIPNAIAIETPSQTEILVKGADKRLVKQVCADIRSYRSPEPYKGKGIRFSGEKIELKETKKK